MKDFLDQLRDLADSLFGTGEEQPVPPEENTAQHPLVEAVAGLVENVHAYVDYCEEQGIYEMAERNGVAFKRLSLISEFQNLESLVARADKDVEELGRVRFKTISELVTSGTKLRAISLDRRSALFTAAEQDYRNMDCVFKGPNLKSILARFFTIHDAYKEKTYPKDMAAFRAAMDMPGMPGDDGRPGTKYGRPGRYDRQI